jgi:lysophospholipase L1-like esterase
MIPRLTACVLWISLVAAFATAAAEQPVVERQHDFAKWEKDIAAFEQKDKERPPRPGGILFIGSSTIRRWDTDKWLPDLKVVNRGFGGSEIIDAVHFAERVVLPHQPRVIVMYSGGNDVTKETPPCQVCADFLAFAEKVHAALPETEILYVSINPSIKRWGINHRMKAANALIEAACIDGQRLHYLDTHSRLLGPDGQPVREYLSEDDLHLSEVGYERLTALVRPEVEKLLQAPAATPPAKTTGPVEKAPATSR